MTRLVHRLGGLLVLTLNFGCHASPPLPGSFILSSTNAMITLKISLGYRLSYLVPARWDRATLKLTPFSGQGQTRIATASSDPAGSALNAEFVLDGLPQDARYTIELSLETVSSSGKPSSVFEGKATDIALHTGANSIAIQSFAPNGVSSTWLPPKLAQAYVDSVASYGPPGRIARAQGVAAGLHGELFLLDNGAVRMIAPDSLGRPSITTIAGQDISLGSGYRDGKGPGALFQMGTTYTGIAVENSNIYVSDSLNHCIRCIHLDEALNATVTTVAGTTSAGYVDGSGEQAQFNAPKGLALASDGSIFVADSGNNCIRKVQARPDGTVQVSTVAGDGQPGYLDGPGPSARFKGPFSVCATSDSKLYVGDTSNHRIRLIDLNGASPTVSTVAGSGAIGFTDGTGASAKFNSIQCLTLGPDQCLYVFDQRVRRVAFDASGNSSVTTLAGGGSLVNQDGSGLSLGFPSPGGALCWDPANGLRLASGHAILNITDLISGDSQVTKSFGDYLQRDLLPQNGVGIYDHSYTPNDLVVGADGSLIFSTFDTSQIFALAPNQLNSAPQLLAGDGKSGHVDGPGASAEFATPQAMLSGPDGGLYLADYLNHCIRRLERVADGSMVVSTFCGDPATADHVDGPLASARFGNPNILVYDEDGNILVSDGLDKTIRKITISGSSPRVETIAGVPNSSGHVDGPGNIAQFSDIHGLAVDGLGTIYVSDSGNRCIRKIAKDQNGNYNVSTITNGTGGYADGPLEFARFTTPWEITFDPLTSDLLVIDDTRLRGIHFNSSGSAQVYSIAGGDSDYADGPASTARFGKLAGIAVGTHGEIYLSDAGNRVIRRITR